MQLSKPVRDPNAAGPAPLQLVPRAAGGDAGPKIALVCLGIGRVRRGFERYFGDLFELLRDRVDITLFKGGGESTERERVPAMLGPATSLCRLLPLGVVAEGAEFRTYKHDCLAFAITLIPHLMAGRYDVVHVIDFPLAVALHRLQKILPFRARLVFTNGCCMPHEFVPASAAVHHVAEPYFQDALEWGVSAAGAELAPCGFYPERFEVEETKAEIRARYGIPASTFVILAVCALKRMHKRVDHIIEEVSRLDGDFLLWLDGAGEDSEIPEMAKRLLGDRCRITQVHSEKVGELYRMADIMVHAALSESFGLSIIEGLSTGLRVLVHDSPHFKWLTGDDSLLLDMTVPGELAHRLALERERLPDGAGGNGNTARSIRERFGWSALARQYEAMYRRLASAPRS